MLGPKGERPTEERTSFFRQSGWLMIANVVGGIFTWAVHFLSKPLGPTEYGLFVALLSVTMCIPTMPLQMVLAQQTAKATALGRERELSGMVRLVWLGTFVLWLIASVIVLLFQSGIAARWGMTNVAGLWVTLPVLLLALWLPMFWGVLQGQQNFLWYGWSMIVNGVGRLAVAVLTVVVFGAVAASVMTGVLAGYLVATGLALWQARSVCLGPSAPFDWGALLRQVIPLMLGFGAFQFLFTADTMFAKAYFDADTVGFYGSAGTLSRALMWMVGPLAAVMFPRIVHSTAKAEKTNLMGLVLIGTGVLAILGAVSLSLIGPFVVQIISGAKFVKVASSLLPWYAAAMVPLALSNVLLNNLLARSSFKIVLPLCVLAIGYAFALTRFHETPVMVLQTLGVFNLLMFALCGWFTWRSKQPEAEIGQPATGSPSS